MVLLNQVVQVLTLPDGNRFFIRFVGVERDQRRGVGTTFIDSDHLGFDVMTNSLAKEAQCGCRVPLGGQLEVDGLDLQYPQRGRDTSTDL